MRIGVANRTECLVTAAATDVDRGVKLSATASLEHVADRDSAAFSALIYLTSANRVSLSTRHRSIVASSLDSERTWGIKVGHPSFAARVCALLPCLCGAAADVAEVAGTVGGAV